MATIITTTTTAIVDAIGHYILPIDTYLHTGGNSFTFGETTNQPNLLIFGTILSQGGDAIRDAFGTNMAQITVAAGGLVSAGSDGIEMRSDRVRIVNDGTIVGYGDSGIELVEADEMRITNAGLISGDGHGVQLRGANDSAVVNSGTIAGEVAVDVEGNNNLVNNSGVISAIAKPLSSAVDTAVQSKTTSLEVFTLQNSGDILGADNAMKGGDGIERVFNSGDIVGDVLLGAGNDLYRAAGDGVVAGTVFGDAGNDTIRGASGDDFFDGGDGADLLRGFGGDDDLQGRAGTDMILGGAGDDEISGGSANDTIRGGSGNDVIEGGTGRDRMFGDGGVDTFVWRTLDETALDADADRVRDFESGVDLIDVSSVSGPAFLYLGSTSFSGGGNAELRHYTTVTGVSVIQMDLDGDGTRDGEIRLEGTALVSEADFVL